MVSDSDNTCRFNGLGVGKRDKRNWEYEYVHKHESHESDRSDATLNHVKLVDIPVTENV